MSYVKPTIEKDKLKELNTYVKFAGALKMNLSIFYENITILS